MELIDFTEKDRFAIAEFVYSYNSDILIKGDAQDLIDVLERHNLVSEEMGVTYEQLRKNASNNSNGVGEQLMLITSNVISEKQGLAIMDDYYGRKKYEEAIAE